MNEIKTMDARKTKNNRRKGKKMEVGEKKEKGKSKQEDSRKSEIKASLFFSFLLSHCSGRKKKMDIKVKKENERYLLRVIFIYFFRKKK